MNYQEALDFLHDLCKFGINLGLERIELLLRLLGEPQKKIKTIHIAGTNGKGSTTAIIASILQEAKLKVGVYTSPHLHSYSERIRINGTDIEDNDFAREMEKIKNIVPQVLKVTGENPTEFEILTALAFNYFSQQQVDIAVIEVGMGGRLDSTNVILPEVSVLTSISKDHTDYLGNTIEAIAREKAGIIKHKRPVVSAYQDAGAEEVIKQTCRELDCPVFFIKEYSFNPQSYNSQGQVFHLNTDRDYYSSLHLALLGDHQIENAIVAIKTIETLQSQGWKIEKEQIYSGIRKVKWPGRLEYHQFKTQVLFDGAHNPEGARSLSQAIPKYFNYRKLIFVLGVLGDKDKQEIIRLLGPLGDVFVVTKPPNQRAGDWESLINLLEPLEKEIITVEDYHQAIDKAFSLGEKDDLLCITGSLYLLGESREYVLKKFSCS
ncbi:MAG: bifunctional folylpolyglutamate synthase/dihydrofolate synthase [Bacillota bacterium]